jgi:hypothetical protein
MHDVTSRRGLQLRARGNGLVFTTSEGLGAKASSVSRDLSKAALERRLGAFVPAATALQVTRSGYQRRPMAQEERSSRLYEQYRQEREAALDARGRAIARLREQRGCDEQRFERISQRRWAAVRLVAKGRVAWALWSAYARQADRRERERARNRYRAAVRAAAAQHPRPSWLEWLRNRAVADNAEALAIVRNRSTPATEARKPYGGPRRTGTTLEALTDLRDVSVLPVVRFGRAPEVLLPPDTRRHVAQRRGEQSDLGLPRDSAQRRVDKPAPHHRPGRRR